MLEFQPVWFDSLGAKSSCTLVKTDAKILIDPGIAVMHRTFPASEEKKREWYEDGRRRVEDALRGADLVVISHYHHDHYLPFQRELYSGKTLLVKDPNLYINDSQRVRAEKFFEELLKSYGHALEDVFEEQKIPPIPDPAEEMPIAMGKDFGDYSARREEILSLGREWFRERVERWRSYRRIPELSFDNLRVKFADGRELCIGETRLRFSRPVFHGIEFSRLGWVVSTVVEYGGFKLLHSSDLNGPIVEDYACWIISENPDFLILDGPMTYMLGYTLNRINLRRSVENAVKILEGVNSRIIVYDHHLTRDPKFRERTGRVWERARELGKELRTVAELLGEEPAVFRGL